MKRLAIAAIAVLALGMGSMPAAAQQFAEGFGDLYFTTDLAVDPFDADPDIAWPAFCIDNEGVPAFSTLNFFLVIRLDFNDIGQPGQNLSNGFGGYEVKATVPAALTVTARTKQPPSSLNVGSDAEDNWIVGTGLTVTAASTPFAVVEYNSILLAAASDVELTLNKSEPSSFDVAGGPGAVPGWLEGVPTGDCMANGNPSKCLRPFDRWMECENTFLINYTGAETCAQRCAVATTTESWGSVKSKF